MHFFKIFKNQCGLIRVKKTLRVNKSKPTFRNAFFFVLHQKVKNNQNMIKEPSFGTPRGLLICLLTLSLRTTPAGVVPGYFNFGHFLATSCCVYKKRLSSLKFTLNLASKRKIFCRLSVPAWCCTASQYSEIACIFSKSSVHSKG